MNSNKQQQHKKEKKKPTMCEYEFAVQSSFRFPVWIPSEFLYDDKIFP